MITVQKGLDLLTSRLKKLWVVITGIYLLLFSSFIPGVLALENNSADNSSPIWTFKGRRTNSEKYARIDPNSLLGRDTLRLTYNLHGTCLNEGDGQIIFDQAVPSESGNTSIWQTVDISGFGQNCVDGKQTVDIPLSDFGDLNASQPVGNFHAKFFSLEKYAVDVNSAVVFNSSDPGISQLSTVSKNENFYKIFRHRRRRISSPSPSPSLTPLPLPSSSLVNPLPSSLSSPNVNPSPSPLPSPSPKASPSPSPKVSSSPSLSSPSPSPSSQPTSRSWDIQSVSSMKMTKDLTCNQASDEEINNWLDKAKEIGANYVAIETPYEDPYCGSAVEYTKRWVQAIRDHNLKVWHRHMPLAFEGIYNTNKTTNIDALKIISNYIKDNPFIFESGDIFTPIPEPQNGGISGVTYCAEGICQFDGPADFNKWLRDAMDVSNTAFQMIGLNGEIRVGYFGFDGYIVWGDNNPDWTGILEDETVKKMGNVTIDHYPEAVGDTMKNDLDEVQAKYPNTPIVIGEWGTITTDGSQVQQVDNSMGAAKRKGVVGFNYWHLGMGGNEALINDDYTKREGFDEVKTFYTGLK